MKYKHYKYENALFRLPAEGGGEMELHLKDKGWKPYRESDAFDVQMMGMPVDEAYAQRWYQEGAAA